MAIIMVIDDDPGIQMALGAILEDEGHEVLIAGDGIEALAMLAGPLPDLILLDIMMPQLDGVALLAELEARQMARGVPIVVLTADRQMTVGRLPTPPADYITKPFELEELIEVVERLTPPS